MDTASPGSATAVAAQSNLAIALETLFERAGSLEALDEAVELRRKAIRATRLSALHVVGGVAANRGLRAAAEAAGTADGFTVVCPPLRYCGDNAAMIAAAAAARVQAGWPSSTDLHTALPIDDPRMRGPESP